VQDQHCRKNESGNLTERPLDQFDLESRPASGAIEQRYGKSVALARETGQ